jgi:hypothetical protein
MKPTDRSPNYTFILHALLKERIKAPLYKIDFAYSSSAEREVISENKDKN